MSEVAVSRSVSPWTTRTGWVIVPIDSSSIDSGSPENAKVDRWDRSTSGRVARGMNSAAICSSWVQ